MFEYDSGEWGKERGGFGCAAYRCAARSKAGETGFAEAFGRVRGRAW